MSGAGSGVFDLGVKLDPAKAKSGAVAVERALRQMGREGKDAGDKMQKGADRASTAYAGTTRSLAGLKSALVGLGIGAAATAMTKSIVGIGAGFEQSMATVGGIMTATEKEMVQLTAIAKKMGAETEWSASQAADGLKYLGMAGFSATKAVAALPGVLDLATASGIDLGRAADIASDALTAMGLEVEELERVNHTLVTTITSSNTNMEFMADSLKYSATMARSTGTSIEELSTMIGILGNSGLKGSIAGTSLNMAFIKMGDAMDKLGVDMVKANGEMMSLIEVVEKLNELGIEGTPIMKMFGEQGGKAIGVLQKNLPAYKALLEKITSTTDAHKTLASTMRGTVMGAFRELKSVVESVAIDIFDENKEDIRKFVKDLGQAIRDNKDDIVNVFSIMGEGMLDFANSLPQAVKGTTELFQYILEMWEKFPAGLTTFLAGGWMVGGAPGAALGASTYGIGKGVGKLQEMAQLDPEDNGPMAKLSRWWTNLFPKAYDADAAQKAEVLKSIQAGIDARNRENAIGTRFDVSGMADDFRPYGSATYDPGTVSDKELLFATTGKWERPKTNKGGSVDTRITEQEKTRLQNLTSEFGMAAASASEDPFADQWLQYERDQQKWQELVDKKKITEEQYVQWKSDAFDKIFDEEVEYYENAHDAHVAVLEDREEREKVAAQKALQNSEDMADGVLLGLSRVNEASQSMAEAIADVTEGAIGTLSDGLVNAAMTGEMAFDDMAKSIMQQMMKIAVQQSIIKPLVASIFHDGGMVGAASMVRAVSPGMFAGAARYHSGGDVLGAGEVPAILKAGEIVLNAAQQQNIAAQLTGKGGSTYQFNATFNLPTPSGNSEKDNAYMKEAAKQIQAKMDAWFTEKMREAQRPGGTLNGGVSM